MSIEFLIRKTTQRILLHERNLLKECLLILDPEVSPLGWGSAAHNSDCRQSMDSSQYLCFLAAVLTLAKTS